jgi:putative ABC transport system permease protein
LAAGLLVAAGLLLKSLVLLQSVPSGFEASHLITASLPLPETSYGTPARRQMLVDALTERLRNLPGVESVGLTNSMALAGSFMMSGDFTIAAAPPTDRPPEANLVAATPGYFHATGMALLAGRYLTDADARSGGAALVNEAAARRFFGSPQQAVGRYISGGVCKSCQIVGVVGNVRNFGLKNDSAPELYGPLSFLPCPTLDLAVRTYADPAHMLAAVRASISAVAPDIAIDRISTMPDVLREYVAEPRFHAVLVGLFAMLALLLAAIGVFGVTAFSVTQRTREIGLRMALGAKRETVLRMVLGQSLVAGGAGVAAGVGLALIVTRLLRSLLFGVAARDPATFLVVGASMLAMILLAAWIPARRAARVDPMTALRHE